MRLAGIGAGLAFIALASAAAADPAAMSATDWTVTIGVEGRVAPSYEGSDRYIAGPLPLFDVRPAGTPAHFRAPRDGFGVGILDTGVFRAGPTFKFRFPRRESEDLGLQGLGNVDWAYEAGGFLEYWPVPWFRTRLELRQGFGGHHGVTSDLMADVVVPLTPALTLSGGPRLTFATDAATVPYFSVTPEQSIASGLPAYNAKGGLHSFGAGVQARYEWSRQWASHVFFEYEQLAGDAANSPIVTQFGARQQIQVGIGVTYSFDMPRPW